MSATVANGRAKEICGARRRGVGDQQRRLLRRGRHEKQVHPGQMGWFTTPDPCGSFDYDCDGTTALQLAAGGACDATPTTCTAGFVADTACGAVGDYQTCDSAARLRRPRDADAGVPLADAKQAAGQRHALGVGATAIEHGREGGPRV